MSFFDVCNSLEVFRSVLAQFCFISNHRRFRCDAVVRWTVWGQGLLEENLQKAIMGVYSVQEPRLLELRAPRCREQWTLVPWVHIPSSTATAGTTISLIYIVQAGMLSASSLKTDGKVSVRLCLWEITARRGAAQQQWWITCWWSRLQKR